MFSQRETVSIVDEYDKQRALYSDYANTLYSLILKLLAAENFRPHSVQKRVKDRTSLAIKVLSDPKYSRLEDVTDVAGIRIITYFADEVARVASIIKREFQVDKEINKGEELRHDQFGLSLTAIRREIERKAF